MTITHGMQVEEIERLGRDLQQRFSPAVVQLIGEIDRAVNDTTGRWVGPDAERFRSWWPEKRSRLRAMAADLEDYGRIAAGNAAAQRQVSGTGSPGAGGGGRGVGVNRLSSGGGSGSGSGPGSANPVRRFGEGLRQVNDGTWLIAPFVSTFDFVGEQVGIPIPGYGVADKALTGFDYATQGFTIFEQVADGSYVDAGLDSAFLGGDVAAGLLKGKATPVTYLAGMAVQSVTEAARAATEVDWSPEGLRMIRDTSLSDWAEILPGSLLETGKTTIKVVAP